MALGQQVLAQFAVLMGAVLYAGAAIYGKRLSHLPPIVAATGTMLWATACLVPLCLALEQPWQLRPSLVSLGAALTPGCSVHRAGAAFVFPAVENPGIVGSGQPGVFFALGWEWRWACSCSMRAFRSGTGLGLVVVMTGVAAINWWRKSARVAA